MYMPPIACCAAKAKLPSFRSTASRLGRASRSLDTVRRKTRENSSLALIGVIIVVLTILILLVKL